MKHSCNFNMNPAFFTGVTLLFISTFVRNVLEAEGAALSVCHLLAGASCGLLFIGLLYGSPKTRPVFHRFHAFKLRLLGRGAN